MSFFSELIPKLSEISKAYLKNFQDDVTESFDYLDKFEEDYLNRNRGRGKAQKDKVGTTPLQSINEDEAEPNKAAESKHKSKSKSGSSDSNSDRRASKKRSKNEVDDMFSPEVDKRQKRNASVKAQSIISKQVNVNLTAKLRREKSNEIVENSDKPEKKSSQSRSRRQKDDKENAEPNISAIQIKEEKLSLPSEPMDMDALPINIPIKQELNKDDIAMPPPAVPVPKPRKGVVKKNSVDSSEDETGKQRSSRTKKKPAEAMPPPTVPVTRAARASSRATRLAEAEEQPSAEARPKRTRAKKKVSTSEIQSSEVDSTQESISAATSPAEKPRPKRTRRGKAANKQEPKPEPIISPKEELVSPISPILQIKSRKTSNSNLTSTTTESAITINSTADKSQLEETRVIARDMDNTVVISTGIYNCTSVPPKSIPNMNETVVISKSDEKIEEKTRNIFMNATVVIEKCKIPSNLTEDNSLITDDESERECFTPPRKDMPEPQPSSAVKEKVQKFEEMASRVTRTKTRAMAMKEEQTENQTPPDKISKPILSAETLTKMNSLIFNGKPPQISSSASKPRPTTAPASKSLISSSTSKLSAVSKHKEAAEDSLRNKANEEDAKKKKEALLEAKREMQKRKREEKMAAAAAARNNAEKERKAQFELAARERMEKQAHVDAGKQERIKEAERKKQELARKVAETEERRKAEEAARMKRLAEEQRKALAQRRKQIEEQEAMRKEEAIMAKEIEKRQKEYLNKQKMKSRLDDKVHTPLKAPGTPGAGYSLAEPAHMEDGFQYLNSDSDEEPPPRPVPEWSTSKARKQQLDIQSQISCVHVDRLFSVRRHTPDLREIFPNIERSRLKRTSSAVWRTPPQLLTTVHE